MPKVHNVIINMLNQYVCRTDGEYTNALKEIIQKTTLLALWRSKFFEKAAFYGGTALRILHGLDRFSEDLDFSLLKPVPNFELDFYNEAIGSELESYGLLGKIETKQKSKKNSIQSAFIKTDKKEQFILISVPENIVGAIPRGQQIKIKMEVDIDPPLYFETENKLLLNPMAFSVNAYQKPDLFATKVHAILCRQWGMRVKGRDWFDFVWYIAQNVPLRVSHLESRLIHSGAWSQEKQLTQKDVLSLLEDKIAQLEIDHARQDVLPFIQDSSSIDIWSKNFFLELIQKMRFI